MDYVSIPLLVFILTCLVHLEYKIGVIDTIIKRLDKNSKVEGNNPKGRKKQKGVS
jgi:hypothetical protein